MMNRLSVSGVAKHAGVDRPMVLRPLRSKFARITPARSFDMGLSWMDTAVESKDPPYRARYGSTRTAPAPADEPSAAVSPPEDRMDKADREQPSPADALTDVDALRRMVVMLEEQNTFLRSRLVAADETLRSVLGLLAERDKS